MDNDGVWVSADKKLQVYVDRGLNAGTVRVLLPSAVNLKPREAVRFAIAIIDASAAVTGRKAPDSSSLVPFLKGE